MESKDSSPIYGYSSGSEDKEDVASSEMAPRHMGHTSSCRAQLSQNPLQNNMVRMTGKRTRNMIIGYFYGRIRIYRNIHIMATAYGNKKVKYHYTGHTTT
jgi:hypothetical protein